MIVGYTNQSDDVFCTGCWLSHAEAGARPCRVLDTEDPEDPDDNFWIVDVCEDCGKDVKYKHVRALD